MPLQYIVCLYERDLLLLFTRFYVQVISMTGMYIPYRNFYLYTKGMTSRI